MDNLPKIDRKTLKTPDEFVQRGRRLLGLIVEQRARFVPVLGLILVTVAVVYAFDWWTRRQVNQAWTQFEEIQRAPEGERWEKLKAFASSGGRGRAPFFASLAVADHYLSNATKENGKAAGSGDADAQVAAEWYQKALAQSDLLPNEKALLHLNRGNSLELLKKWDEAQAEYQSAVELSSETKPLLLLASARVFEAKGESTKAAETYEKVAVDSATNEYGRQAKLALRRLKSPLFQTSATKGG